MTNAFLDGVEYDLERVFFDSDSGPSMWVGYYPDGGVGDARDVEMSTPFREQVLIEDNNQVVEGTRITMRGRRADFGAVQYDDVLVWTEDGVTSAYRIKGIQFIDGGEIVFDVVEAEDISV